MRVKNAVKIGVSSYSDPGREIIRGEMPKGFSCEDLCPVILRTLAIPSGDPRALLFYGDSFLKGGAKRDITKPIRDERPIFVRLVRYFCQPVVERPFEIDLRIYADGAKARPALPYWFPSGGTVATLLSDLAEDRYIRSATSSDVYWLQKLDGSKDFSIRPADPSDLVPDKAILRIDDFGEARSVRDPSSVRRIPVMDRGVAHVIPFMLDVFAGERWADLRGRLVAFLGSVDPSEIVVSWLFAGVSSPLADTEVPFTVMPQEAIIEVQHTRGARPLMSSSIFRTACDTPRAGS
jgi:hypothetical protein